MKYEYTIKNDKFNRKKIFYIVIIMVVFAIIIGGLFWFINKDNIYDKYNVYDKKNKDIGTIEHYKDCLLYTSMLLRLMLLVIMELMR